MKLNWQITKKKLQFEKSLLISYGSGWVRSDRVSNQTLGWSSIQGANTNKIVLVWSEDDKGLGSEAPAWFQVPWNN